MDIKEFETLRDQNIGHFLLKASRLYQKILIEGIREYVKDDRFRPSHLQLFAHIPLEGITIVELASIVGISKQAMSVMVNDLIDMKVLIKSKHPVDKRSAIIKFNFAKNSQFLRGVEFISEFDQIFLQSLGKQNSKKFLKMHRQLIDALEAIG